MKRLLVPTDFSREAQQALGLASDLAKKLDAELLLLHVMEVPYGSFSVLGEVHVDYSFEQVYQVQLINKTKEKLEEVVAGLKGKGIKAEYDMVFGNAFEGISKAIFEKEVDLIIMGSKGASGLKEIFIGSNAERVIRNAKCPVITVKGATDLANMKSMVFASDMSEEQDQIVSEIKKLQNVLQLNIHLVRVKTPYNYLTEGAALKQLKDFVKRNEFKDYTISTIEAEFADEGILKFAEENKVGLIAMGTHGRTGLAHFFGGSTAEAVANHSKIPIWTLKLEDILEPKS